MKSLVLAAGLLILPVGQAMASLSSCGSGTTSLSTGSTEFFGNAFSSAQTFNDCYSFSIGSSADAFGGTLTLDPLSFLDISINSVILSGAGLSSSLVDTTPGAFSFDGLLSGTYQLYVSGSVTKGKGFDDILPLPVGYTGSLSAIRSTAVPEPSTLALFGMGLIGISLLRRRFN